MTFLGFRCRGNKKEFPFRCRGLIGGPSINTLFKHDFNTEPFVDVRRCPECRHWVRITITNLENIPVIEILQKDERLDFKEPEEMFSFIEVHK